MVNSNVKKAIRDLGFTVAEVKKTKCFLTPAGMKRLRPCNWAKEWINKHGTVEINEKTWKEWIDQAPFVWLGTRNPGGKLGPRERWPWQQDGRNIDWATGDLSSPINSILLLKTYIMKYGKKS